MTHQVAWSWPIVWEEFLFGIAAGAFIVAALVDIMARKPEHRSILRPTFVVAALAAIIGQVILVLELGRPERAAPTLLGGKGALWGAFQNFFILGTSVMARTAVFLVIFLAISIVVAGGWLLMPGLLVGLRRIVEGVGIIFAIPAGLQAGLLLQAATKNPFWATAVFPYLYLITGVLAGMGLLGLFMVARNFDAFRAHASSLLTYSLLLIIVEAGALAAHFTLVSAPREVIAVLTGTATITLLAPTFYVGALGLGMLVPGAYAAKVVRNGFAPSRTGAAVAFVLLIVGSLALRVAFLFAGQVV